MAKDQHIFADAFSAPPGVSVLRTEDVLLLAVSLPRMPAAQRRNAVAFAVEDQIARPLEDVHVVLGPQVDASWLVAVVARDVLAAAPRRRLVPDVLMVPVPAVGEWSVVGQGARLLVRCADGTGFATSADAFGVFHLAAGRPGLVVYGGELPDGLIALRRDVLPSALDARFAKFDLNSARVQAFSARLPRGLRGFAWLIGAAMVGHLTLLGADTLALTRLRDAKMTEVRAAGGLADGADIEAAVMQAQAVRQVGGQSTFLPQLSAIFAAMTDQAGQVSVRDLRYVAAQESVVLTVEAQDIATLQDVETALTSAGLSVAAGAATSGNGLAEQQLTIAGGAP